MAQKHVAKLPKASRNKRGRKPLTEAEREPDARFKRVAGIRVAKILKLLKGLRNCANPSVYEYDETQVSAMFKALDKAITRTKEAYANPVENGKATTLHKLESFFS